MQTRTESLIESALNTAVGLLLSVAVQSVVFPWFGWNPELHQNFAIAGIFTLVSVARNYAMRRFGARWITRAARRAAA